MASRNRSVHDTFVEKTLEAVERKSKKQRKSDPPREKRHKKRERKKEKIKKTRSRKTGQAISMEREIFCFAKDALPQE